MRERERARYLCVCVCVCVSVRECMSLVIFEYFCRVPIWAESARTVCAYVFCVGERQQNKKGMCMIQFVFEISKKLKCAYACQSLLLCARTSDVCVCVDVDVGGCVGVLWDVSL